MGRARPAQRRLYLQKLGGSKRPMREWQGCSLQAPTRLSHHCNARREAGIRNMAVDTTLMGWRGGYQACGLLFN